MKGNISQCEVKDEATKKKERDEVHRSATEMLPAGVTVWPEFLVNRIR
jgi:hypothetical protein